jgi:hypothetical protein
VSHPPLPPGTLRERIASRDRFNVAATAFLAGAAIVGLFLVVERRGASSDHIPILVIAVGITAFMLWWALARMGRLERRADFARLASFGSPEFLIDDIERELQCATVSTIDGRWWLTPKWLVSFDDNVRILPIDDVMGVASVYRTKAGRLRPRAGLQRIPSLVIWMRDEYGYQTVSYLTPVTPRNVVAMVASVHPALAVQDPIAFGRQWDDDRPSVQRHIDTALGRPPELPSRA